MSFAWSKHRALLALVAAGVLGMGIASGLLSSKLAPPRSHSVASRPIPAATPLTAVQPPAAPTPDHWWKPLPTATAAFQPALLVIEKLRVQAPIEVKGVDARNVMEAPDRPTDAVWYRFTARPGSGGNAVFSGHRDFGQPGTPAIFWHLDQLVPGDAIDVVSDKQTQIRYRVIQTWDYSLTSIPMQQVLAADPTDEVTLITASGTYVRGGYDHRLVVRAVRTS
jgi:sortase family protein